MNYTPEEEARMAKVLQRIRDYVKAMAPAMAMASIDERWKHSDPNLANGELLFRALEWATEFAKTHAEFAGAGMLLLFELCTAMEKIKLENLA